MQYVGSVDFIMPKKIKNCFYKNLTFDKLLKAHQRARKHKSYKHSVIKFELNLENNIVNLLNNIRNWNYHIGEYYNFVIYEPKERLIKALPYIDRIVHQWYIEEFIKPYIIPRFISTSFACLSDKGTHKAVKCVQKQMREFQKNNENFWILKCDIRKFFYSIDPYILFDIMKKYIADKALLKFTWLIIFDGRPPGDNVGIPIGNYTSQFFANIYMNELDQFVKRELKIQYYVRYMDDFILLLPTKKDCINIKKIIEEFIESKLHLSLNNKSKYYPCKMGVNFCGYRIFPTHILLRNSSKKKIKKNVKKWNNLYANQILDVGKALQSLNSWLGHSSHCNSYKLQNKILDNCNFLFRNNYCLKVEEELVNLIEQDNRQSK